MPINRNSILKERVIRLNPSLNWECQSEPDQSGGGSAFYTHSCGPALFVNVLKVPLRPIHRPFHSSMFFPFFPNFHQITVRATAISRTTLPVMRYAMGRKQFGPPNQVSVVSTTSFLPWKGWTGKSGKAEVKADKKGHQRGAEWKTSQTEVLK